MKLLIYILSYNDESYNYAYHKYNKYNWAKIIKIKTTKLFESIMYDTWLIDNEDDWKNYDYIGFLSWKADQKINISNENIDYIKNILEQDNSYEIIPMYIRDEYFIFCSKYLFHIINILYNELGYPRNYVIENNFLPFFCNYWIAKKDVLYEYINFFKKCKNIIDNNHEIQKYINENIEYGGILKENELMNIFNKPYYCYHPFIYERLPIFFFHNKKKLII